ncbi:MAG: hypothetical protein PVF89_02140 [Lysobacterales bacterium]|jgi:hypothetical protein
MINIKITLRCLLPVFMAALLAGCPQSRKAQGLTDVLKRYEITVRWAQWDTAVDFIAPEYLEQHPISRLEMDRLRLFRVTQYTPRSSLPVDNGKGLRQVVEIHMFNKNQARERTIIDKQYWRYDDKRHTWLLYSGLPDPTQKDY